MDHIQVRKIAEDLSVAHSIFEKYKPKDPKELEVYVAALSDVEESFRELFGLTNSPMDSVFPATMDGYKMRILYLTLQSLEWDRLASANALGLSPKTVRSWIRQMRANGIVVPGGRNGRPPNDVCSG